MKEPRRAKAHKRQWHANERKVLCGVCRESERERRMSARENALLEGNKKRLIEVLVTMKKRIICLKTTPDNE